MHMENEGCRTLADLGMKGNERQERWGAGNKENSDG